MAVSFSSTAQSVLAVSLRWSDRPLSLDHVKVGRETTLMEGVDVRWEAGLPVVSIAGPFEASVRRGEVSSPAGKRVALEAGDVLCIRDGALTMEARLQPRIEHALPDSRQHESLFFSLVMAHALMIATAFVVAMVITPFTDDDSMWGAPSWTRVLMTPQSSVPKQEAPKLEERVRDALAKSNTPRASPTPTTKPQAQKLLEQLFGGPGSNDVFSKAKSALGSVLESVGPGQGPSVSSEPGGFGSREIGPGGPGGESMHIGRIGVNDGPRGPPSTGLKKRLESIVCANCTPSLSADYDRDLVLKVVKRHQNEIRFCYESELTRDPSLAGKVTVSWTIAGTGEVEAAVIAESGLSNAKVEDCIVNRVSRWRFAEPKGGGEVRVTFPWVFQVAGED